MKSEPAYAITQRRDRLGRRTRAGTRGSGPGGSPPGLGWAGRLFSILPGPGTLSARAWKPVSIISISCPAHPPPSPPRSGQYRHDGIVAASLIREGPGRIKEE